MKWVQPLYDPVYDPLWAIIEDLELPVSLHCGTGSPNYGRYASVPMIMISEVPFYAQRPFVHLLLSGVFERFPKLKFVITEGSAAWRRGDRAPARPDHRERAQGRDRRAEVHRRATRSPRSASEYFQQNCWIGASFPGLADVDGPHVDGPRPVHVGQRLPARRGHRALHA